MKSWPPLASPGEGGRGKDGHYLDMMTLPPRPGQPTNKSRGNRRSLGLGVSPMTAKPGTASGRWTRDGQTRPLHELCAARPVALGAQPIAIRQVTVRHRTTNHTMDIHHMPDGPIRSGDAEASACDRTRGAEGGPSPCPLDLLDGLLATTKALGGLRSTSHWTVGPSLGR